MFDVLHVLSSPTCSEIWCVSGCGEWVGGRAGLESWLSLVVEGAWMLGRVRGCWRLYCGFLRVWVNVY